MRCIHNIRDNIKETVVTTAIPKKRVSLFRFNAAAALLTFLFAVLLLSKFSLTLPSSKSDSSYPFCKFSLTSSIADLISYTPVCTCIVNSYMFAC